MATSNLYIENKDPKITNPKPRFVRIILNDGWVTNTWKIPGSHINNWIGIGDGTYKYKKESKRLTFMRRDKEWIRMEFFGINYPDDCTPKDEDEDFKTGPGEYHPGTELIGEPLACEWSNRTILPAED